MSPRIIHLAPEDNVVAAAEPIRPGQTVLVDGVPITAADPVAMGHKMAIREIAPGQKVIKYGAPIGSATQAIHAGRHVHTHNLKSDYLPTFARGADPQPAQ